MVIKKRDYSNWTQQEFVDEIEHLRKQKTYGLVFDREKIKEEFDYFMNFDGENAKEIFNPEFQKKFPLLKEVSSKHIVNNEEESNNLLIEGDNYHSLITLNFTHQKQIDVIYIDPPYNTGNKDFIYNDKYVDREDSFRHSKWLNFMEKRLKLARNLLKNSGMILISIDDNEQAQLKILCDEIFGEENFIANIPTIMNLKGNQDQFGFAGTHEYTLVYSRNKTQCNIGHFKLEDEELDEWKEDEYGYFKTGAIKAGGVNGPRHKRPNLYFPIFIKLDNSLYVTDDNKPLSKKDDIIYPISDNKEMSWRWSKDKIKKQPFDIIVKRDKNNKIILARKVRPSIGDMPTKKPKSIFYKAEYSSGNGTNLLKKMFNEKIFNNPKPLELIKDFIKLTSKKNSIILDFMAGSGTTGHAVLELNKLDNGNRKFILCTNNENNICKDVCYPRISKVINGYKDNKGNNIEGLGGNLRYFKTDFVDSEITDENKKKIVDKSTEMICIRENAFEKIENNDEFKIFKNNKFNLGIIFEDYCIEDFIKIAKTIPGKFKVYCFTLDGSLDLNEFREIRDRVKLSPIPEAILHIYRRIIKE
ncbi:MAG: site-specific DNA-methyltransferase [Candidatus Woesearchaeota archaeon]|jgi:adenine-specific DNA-methyltransferase|nr:site-specific DNA-methyltransferase [Candidatus Woesearchaeota archaeon]